MPAETEPVTVCDTAAGGPATAGGPSGNPAATSPAGTGSLDGAGPGTAAGDGAPRYAPEWLALREGADAAARAPRLLGPLVRHWADGRDRETGQPRRPGPPGREGPLVIRDLGCGTGSMSRWLAPRLSGPQHWILHDHDPELLELAAERMPRTAADGSPVTVGTEQGDATLLTADVLAGTSLVTASALLDLLTREEVDALAASCAAVGCPALLVLSVAGRVELSPADPLDGEIAEAFNAHQRRAVDGRRLLGPDAVTEAAEAFTRHGLTVRTEASPWRLGPGDPAGPAGDGPALAAEWLRGWAGAAVAQRPELAEPAETYLRRRLESCAAGELRAVVHHSDLLALPAAPAGGTP
ncbi:MULTISPECIES: class I SAM-dependent methyltransferase [Streptomyces]|uniref:Class I SAM-dependent methyltransferase n=1 Tax=Streptomyces xinghaiensis TaxID=1038928 RepID=A0A3R7HMM8_9ACTN|nr:MULTISPECIES: class I SAM-dependent methyltransferase [Streptomyces]PQM24920.1 class I SAM-dependent methyltransferase [Streptomyces xinghaiensis]RKM98971.1 class I SAM-dependent methyltransferase [Streptomyces xinghaiensis]RNC76126.1 class I SAM-dependent methyltransferase [Streptomyces xinghaiensis]